MITYVITSTITCDQPLLCRSLLQSTMISSQGHKSTSPAFIQPFPSASFHHKLCTWSSQGVCTSLMNLLLISAKSNQPSLHFPNYLYTKGQPSTLTKPSPSLMPKLSCDEPIHSTELFTKSVNVPTELSSQQTMKPTCAPQHTIVDYSRVVKSYQFCTL
jgi:hypothetical protein